MITSDHGEEFFEKKRFSHCHPFDTVLRVPLIFYYPPKIKKNIKSLARAQLIDIAPTVFSMSGIDTNIKFDGLNLYPHMQPNSNTADIDSRPIYAQTFRRAPPAAHAIILGKWKYIDFYLLRRSSLLI